MDEKDRDGRGADLESRAAARVRSEKLGSLGRMAGGIAHDFNNLLLAIMGNADMLDQDLRAGRDGLTLLDEIRKAAGRAADLCNQLLAFAGQGRFNLQPAALSSLAREMSPMLKVAVPRRVMLRLDLIDQIPLIAADTAQVHQVIMNLVVNASEALGERGGTITVATGSGTLLSEDLESCVLDGADPTEEYVYLEVADTGEGMDAETLTKIFDPFFTTKIQGRGLGLASVLGIVRGHQALLSVRSRPGEGSRFRVHFPTAAAGLSATESSLPPVTERHRHGGTVLVVDDEEYLRVLCRRMLKRLGYEVMVADGGRQAVEIYCSEGDRIDYVFLDLVMPELDGVETYRRLVAIDPEVEVVLTSGYHEQEIAARFAGQGINAFLQKPYVVADLADVLGRVRDQRLSRRDMEAPDRES